MLKGNTHFAWLIILMVGFTIIVISVLGLRALNHEMALRSLERSHVEQLRFDNLQSQLVSSVESQLDGVKRAIVAAQLDSRRLREFIMGENLAEHIVILSSDHQVLFPPDAIQALPKEQRMMARYGQIMRHQVDELSVANASTTVALGSPGSSQYLHCWFAEHNYCALLSNQWLDGVISSALKETIHAEAYTVSRINADASELNTKQYTTPMQGLLGNWRALSNSDPLPKTNLQLTYLAALLPILLIFLFVAGTLYWQHRKARMQGEATAVFLRVLAHEMKTPLANLQLFTGLLRRCKTDKEKHEFVDVLESEFARIRRLVNNTIQTETQLLPQQMVPVELGPFIEQLIAPFRPRMDDSELQLRLSLPVETTINVSREALECVIVNLIDNAIKYAHGANVNIEISLINRKLKLSYFDNGPGLSETIVADILNGQVKVRSEDHGFGLGLYVTHRMVNASGGLMTVVACKPIQIEVYLPAEA